MHAVKKLSIPDYESLSPSETVEAVYELMLQRPVDAAGRASWEEVIAAEEYSGLRQVQTIAASEEFAISFDSIERDDRLHRTDSMLELLELEGVTAMEKAQMIYHFVLNRAIDEAGAATCAEDIKNGDFSTSGLIERIVESVEFEQPYLRPPPLQRLHGARSTWVSSLPPGKRVLDIGGSSPTEPAGALIELGYAHKPEKLTIFDKPPHEQFWGTPNYSQDNTRTYPWGEVQYMHGYAEDILKNEELREQMFDIIYMGQVVEHIYEDKMLGVLKWIRSHLADGGTFFFDTPNRLITLFQTGEGEYIDPDHKTEYTPDEFAELLLEAGLKVTKEWGILEMPNVAVNRSFSREDYYGGALLSSSATDSYCFAMACQSTAE